jgi:glycosyltransferase involved in cell wall biosynthesis
MAEHSPRILALLPAYREAETVGPIVSALKQHGFDVLVVDDASGDRTGERAAAAGARVVRLPFNLGYGGALQTGYMYARGHDYDAVVQLDADGQHDPACAGEVLAPVLAGEADVVLGSRFLAGATYPMPWARRLGQRVFGGVVRLITGKKLTDPTSGYQALSRRALAAYCTRLFPDDYPDADMFIILHRMGIRVVEVPTRMRPNSNQSMHKGIVRPLYYIFKMSLAILMATFRKLPKPPEKDTP